LRGQTRARIVEISAGRNVRKKALDTRARCRKLQALIEPLVFTLSV